LGKKPRGLKLGFFTQGKGKGKGNFTKGENIRGPIWVQGKFLLRNRGPKKGGINLIRSFNFNSLTFLGQILGPSPGKELFSGALFLGFFQQFFPWGVRHKFWANLELGWPFPFKKLFLSNLNLHFFTWEPLILDLPKNVFLGEPSSGVSKQPG